MSNIMKKLMKYFVALLILIVSIACQKEDSLKIELSKTQFTVNQQEDLYQLVLFFESEIANEENDLDLIYRNFIIRYMDGEEDFNTMVKEIFTKKELKELWGNMDKATISELWSPGKTRLYRDSYGREYQKPIRYESIGANCVGHYDKYLKSLEIKQPSIVHYRNLMHDYGDFPSDRTLYGMVLNYDLEWQNLNQAHWRIIWSVQVLTAVENVYREEEAVLKALDEN